MAQRIMALAGIDLRGANVAELRPDDAAERLSRGELDVLVVVESWDSPLVRKLVAAPDISLVSFRRADAFVALNPELTKLVLPKGLEIAPVLLNFKGKNRELVGLGSYLVNAVGGCNDCHTGRSGPGFGETWQSRTLKPVREKVKASSVAS